VRSISKVGLMNRVKMPKEHTNILRQRAETFRGPLRADRKRPKRAATPRSLAPLRPDDLLRLGSEAVAELTRRGYDLRGKSADEIKKILRFPPPKRKPMAEKCLKRS
jgi:hypothetical protein